MKTKKKPVEQPAKVKPYRFTKEQKMWLKDLETTKAKQATSRLTRINPKSGRVVGHCCLGRACIVFRLPFGKAELTVNDKPCRYYGQGDERHSAFLPPSLVKLLKLRGDDGDIDRSIVSTPHHSLASMNDTGKFTFKQIAKFIRKYPRAVFKD